MVHTSRRRRNTPRSLRSFCRHSIRCWRLIGCVLGGAAFVVMMQTAHFTKLHHRHPLLDAVFFVTAVHLCRAPSEFSTYGNKRSTPLVSDAESHRRIR